MEAKKIMSVSAWVARDESFGGHLHLFPQRPSRFERLTIENGVTTVVSRMWQTECAESFDLDDLDCPALVGMTWSDEPVLVRMELWKTM